MSGRETSYLKQQRPGWNVCEAEMKANVEGMVAAPLEHLAEDALLSHGDNGIE